jgi:hypothetical protein
VVVTQDVISVRGYDVDLRAVYRRMCDEARSTSDGRLVHDAGLKYLLADMFGLKADSGTPRQPLFDLRREIAAELRRRHWIAETGGKNNGRYELLPGDVDPQR